MAYTYSVYYPMTSGSATNASDIWYNWNAQMTGGSITVTTGGAQTMAVDCWPYWNNVYGSQTPVYVVQPQAQREPTAEERQLWARQAEESRLNEQKREKERQEATKRAEELLFVMLSDEQKKQYREKGYFETEVNDRKYRLYKGRAGNIRELNKEGKEAVRLCVHPATDVPDADTMLAQYLALHTDEEALRRTANHTRLM